MGKGTTPQNLVISWTTMPQVEHNAPKFMYRVYYKRDIPGEKWNIIDISDWRRNNLLVENQPTYQRYKIKVVAINERGESTATADEVIGYSGEDGTIHDEITLLLTNTEIANHIWQSIIVRYNIVKSFYFSTPASAR